MTDHYSNCRDDIKDLVPLVLAARAKYHGRPISKAAKAEKAAANLEKFKITEPTCINFSGGRTSAYMTWKVIQANEGMPADACVVFANTGKESEETLEFVRDCGELWGIYVWWVEYIDQSPGFKVVNFNTASRNGEPFEALIRRRKYLPHVKARFCTSELKINAASKFLKHVGWSDWSSMVGIRADEPVRIAKIRNSTTSDFDILLPLADAGVTVQEVDKFWMKQPFSLGLVTSNNRTLAGNCDLCFMKPYHQKMSLISERPSRAIWWATMESQIGAKFRFDEPDYLTMAKMVEDQQDLFGHEDGSDDAPSDCFCGDGS